MPDRGCGMMDISQRKEQFSFAFVRAVATVAGNMVAEPAVDDDSIDLWIGGRVGEDIPRPPRIELQVKCTSARVTRGEHLVYALKRKNYDDLRLADPIVPRILVVVLVPTDESEWLRQTEEELSLRYCAYWTSLRGMEETKNRGRVTIHVPRANIFSVEGLRDLMKQAARKEPI
jgi:Domain of unknown function (DUF4365)